LSVADFSHALAFLHPNWPDNLFGKVYFLQPEFLILPILAFASLLFLKKTSDNRGRITFFAFLALIGAFFAKGINDPFAGIFNWCFIHLPGFLMFRDPTKFYLFTAIGYAVLIPYCLEQLCGRMKKFKWVIYTVFILFWCFTTRPLFLGQLTGNFRVQTVPQEYIQLKDMLVSDRTPSRTLWMPSVEKFAYVSDIHPSLAATDVFKNASISGLMNIATSSAFVPAIAAAGVRYVIVPQDVGGTIFMTDYTFDPMLRQDLINALQHTLLKQDTVYHHIAVFENTQFSFHADIPAFVAKQEYWSRVGLLIDGMVLVILAVFLLARYILGY
jgi:hypothetical protein